jgi:G3E family GTPase
MTHSRIPVWLLTGFLGAGKTSLLLNWLQEPALSNAAVVINEMGEVGLDHHLVRSVVDSASVLSGQCVCCSGLEGLEQTLADLWWDRLYRKRPFFDTVVIETTGLAHPDPIQQSFRKHPILRERYHLQATVTAFSVHQGLQVLEKFQEAKAQIAAADIAILTKADLGDPSVLMQTAKKINATAQWLTSANASVRWNDLLAAHACAQVQKEDHSSSHSHLHSYSHHPGTLSQFVETPKFKSMAQLRQFINEQITSELTRLKGIVDLEDGSKVLVQWAVHDLQASLSPYDGALPQKMGVTRIVQA